MFWRTVDPPQKALLRMERRLAPRRSCAIVAEVVFDGGRRVVPCVIRNVSDSGAKLELRSLVGIPASLVLRGAGFQPQQCRVVWRTLREMGVTFERA